MTKIKKHQCPSCGGSLIIDNDKQMYHCTFCGSSYDYEYFREEQMHTMGDTFLSRGEYMAAIDAFRFILKKDPHDFIALRGLLLAATHLNSMEELVNEEKEFSYDPELIDEAVEGALEEDKEYFTEFDRIYSDKKELNDLNDEIEALRVKKRKIGDYITLNGEKREDYYIYNERYNSKTHPKVAFIIGWVVVAFLAGFSIYLIAGLIEYGLNEGTAVMLFLLIFNIVSIGGVTAINYASNYRKMNMLNELDRQTAEYYVEAREIGDRKRNLEDKAEKLQVKIRMASQKFVKMDRLKVSEEKAD